MVSRWRFMVSDLLDNLLSYAGHVWFGETTR